MKKLIFTTAVLLMSFMALSTSAKAKVDGDEVVHTNALWENWFVSGGIGTSMYAGESDRYFPLGKRLAPAFDLSVGKWFTPYFGTRLQYNGPQFRGASLRADNKFVYDDEKINNRYKQKWNYMSFHVDAMFNLSNFIGGYEPERFYALIPYVGAGWMRCPQDKNDAIAANFGLYNSFRVSSRVDLFLDVKAVVIGEDAFDSEGVFEIKNNQLVDNSGDYGMEGAWTATIGVNVRIGKQGWGRPTPQSVLDGYEKTLSQNLSDIEDYKAKLAASNEKNQDLEAKLAEAAKRDTGAETVYETQTNVVRFNFNSSKLSNIAKVNLANVAEVINKTPASKKYSVVGYADRQTGSKIYNNLLSKKRAKAVYKFLTEECGVDSSKLVVDSKGGVDNMFYDDAAVSRVVIIK